MKRILFLAWISGAMLLVISCNRKEADVKPEPAAQSEKKDFKMYEMSEMAALMEQMYVDNQRLKDRIKNGEAVGNFPEHFLKIHQAVMTDESENDAFFKEQAKKFIEAQKQIYADPDNAKTHFNNGVDACVRCHESKCGGPIPRIKKLYIK
ncbi:hypothetical protein [Flavobacterium supellecticarium]|nr:hypothetical protein [Flavobacterium supellecticarium]